MPTSNTSQPPDLSTVIRAIHNAGCPFALAVTGGGSLAIAELLRVPGGSRSVLEAVVPYSAEALTEYLRARPEQFCSEATARLMAMTAWTRAARFAPRSNTVAGIGCTASLASDRPKRGPHRAHVAWQSADVTATWSIELTKGARDRAAEEDLVGRLILDAIAEMTGVNRGGLRRLDREPIVARRCDPPAAWRSLQLGEISAAPGSSTMADRSLATTRLIFPGAFHPRHAGHRQMATLAEKQLGVPVEHEISIVNVDKPPLDFLEMRDRAEQFGPAESFWFTRAARFTEKAAIFPGATFVVGADTIARVANPRYYDDSVELRDRALVSIASQGCRFLVFGRIQGTVFQTLHDLALPPELRSICQEVSPDQFRQDLSSTELRRREQEQHD